MQAIEQRQGLDCVGTHISLEVDKFLREHAAQRLQCGAITADRDERAVIIERRGNGRVQPGPKHFS